MWGEIDICGQICVSIFCERLNSNVFNLKLSVSDLESHCVEWDPLDRLYAGKNESPPSCDEGRLASLQLINSFHSSSLSKNFRRKLAGVDINDFTYAKSVLCFQFVTIYRHN